MEGIKVTTKFFARIREITGKREDTILLRPESSANDFLRELSNRYGKELSEYLFDDKGCLREDLILLINGQTINTSNFDTIKLREDDLLVILPPIGGG